ncbi:MAG: hypothetical protein COV79_05180 [Parcubacteria group bacterium CG11_big_fil_rev_8_21_14_0_20_41_14]|nr:MAG: hypothetical protein COW93_03400 [Parcubacteria group bacterium CG22_combo_CG10-13_8_21_14_all_41_9]PIQ78562.1 MAG: hypothetical protein COV79_05180 [Parcubacteria group bacterium CG11_big_fil_rev_8_21_14_0_20_41_14]PIR57463.1 MAG: hypothetical protein COU72_00820 [Parcubacteria group bacterium CG10_big_fil_rev_8_21_14_0_10_41_35]
MLRAWEEFLHGKRKKKDVILFQANLMDNIFALYDELVGKIYRHGGYKCFKISDPKPRIIHKAKVRDRLVHHLLYQELYPFFDRQFIFGSYSCRLNKGTHRAMREFVRIERKASQNNTHNF